jgi:hypothetical protein
VGYFPSRIIGGGRMGKMTVDIQLKFVLECDRYTHLKSYPLPAQSGTKLESTWYKSCQFVALRLDSWVGSNIL